MKRLMTVNLAPEQKSAVQDICSDIGAECVDIQRKHYGMKVGSLCDRLTYLAVEMRPDRRKISVWICSYLTE